MRFSENKVLGDAKALRCEEKKAGSGSGPAHASAHFSGSSRKGGRRTLNTPQNTCTHTGCFSWKESLVYITGLATFGHCRGDDSQSSH